MQRTSEKADRLSGQSPESLRDIFEKLMAGVNPPMLWAGCFAIRGKRQEETSTRLASGSRAQRTSFSRWLRTSTITFAYCRIKQGGEDEISY